MDNIAKIEAVSADFDTIVNPFTKTSLFIEGSLGMNGKIDGRPKVYSELIIRDFSYKLHMRFIFRYSLARKNWKFGDFEINYSRNWWNAKPEDEIYKAIYSKNSKYKMNILPNGELDLTKNFIQAQPTRKLTQENLGANNDTKSNNTHIERLEFYAGDGLSALIVAFILIFVSLIACGIMMNIYVHTTALVEQPLKLGKIELEL